MITIYRPVDGYVLTGCSLFLCNQSSHMSWTPISNAFRKHIIQSAFIAHGILSSAFRKHIKLSVDSNLGIREADL